MTNSPHRTVSKPVKPGELEIDAQAMQTAEVALVRRAQSGDTEAFSELVRLHQRWTVSVAYRLLGNLEDARDVSQDAFVRAYRGLAQLDDPAKFGAWLTRVVCNLSLNYRRSRKARVAASLDAAPSEPVEARRPSTGRRLTSGLGDEGGPLPEELYAAISDAIDSLPEKQRLALILFSVEGMPQREVATVLDCSIELVKWNVFQARRKLKEMLSDFL